MSDDKLARLAALKRPVRPERTYVPLGAEWNERPVEADELSARVGAEIVRNRYGACLRVRRWFPAPPLAPLAADVMRLLAPEAPPAAADPAQWLFLDTETTGLAGGTGTYAFLVGVAWLDPGGLAVEQLFMRDFAEEHALLAALAARLGERRVLVTFNGKSFDRPLLETRYRMTRAIAARAPAAHLDLLHPARQLWRVRLGSVRLGELEEHVLGAEALGYDRVSDVPSELIPQAYFDYLRGGSAEMLEAVFRHNQLDLRGLAALAAHVCGLLAQQEAAAGEPLELFGLSRLLGRRGRRAESRRLYERALAAGLPGELDRAARRELARLAKRDRDFARATALWEELLPPAAASATTARANVGANFSSPVGARSRSPASRTRRLQNPGDLKIAPTGVDRGARGSHRSGAGAVKRGASNGDGVREELEACEQLAIYYEHRARDPLRAAALTTQALRVLEGAARMGRLDPGRYRRLAARLEHRLARLQRRCGSQQPGLTGTRLR